MVFYRLEVECELTRQQLSIFGKWWSMLVFGATWEGVDPSDKIIKDKNPPTRSLVVHKSFDSLQFGQYRRLYGPRFLEIERQISCMS